MKKHLFVLLALLFLSFSALKSQITFTILNTSGSNSITCANPTLHLLCITNYTTAFVTYTLAGPSGTTIGNNFPVNTPGVYSITAFVNTQVNSTQTLAIGINTQAPLSSLSPTTQNISCSFTSVTTVSASANPTTNAIHYFISPANNTFAVAGTTATYVPGMVGMHTHVLMDQNNGCSVSKIFMVNSGFSIPTVSVSSPQSFTIGCGSNSLCSVGIGGTGSAFGNPVSYTIMNSGSTPGYTTNSQNLYSFSVSGTYTAIVRDNVTGCEARSLFSIITNTSSPNLSLYVNSQTLSCNNSQTSLYGISTSPNTSYLWGIPGSTSSPTSFSVNVSTLASNPSNSLIGTYTFMVVDNSNACSSSTTVTMYQNIYLPNALIANSGPSSVTCSTPSVVLQNQSSTGIPPGTFPNTQSINVVSWNGPSSPTGSLNTYTVFSVGVYTLDILDPNNGCSASANYTLGDARVYPIVNSPAGPAPYCLDPPTTSVDISPVLGGAISSYTYAWTAPANATVSGQNSATLTTNAIGTYTIAVTHTSSGCLSTGTVSVTICTALQESKRLEQNLLLYPNPAREQIHVEISAQLSGLSLELFDPEGRLMDTRSGLSSSFDLDLQHLNKGLYLLRMITADGQQIHRKFLLE